ncbi:hypothetical protein [Chlorogloeopsis sp. ULAP02]
MLLAHSDCNYKKDRYASAVIQILSLLGDRNFFYHPFYIVMLFISQQY